MEREEYLESTRILQDELEKAGKEIDRLTEIVTCYERHYDSEKITNSGDKLADLISFRLSTSGISPHSWAQVVGNIRAGLKSILAVYEAKAEKREEKLRKRIEEKVKG